MIWHMPFFHIHPGLRPPWGASRGGCGTSRRAVVLRLAHCQRSVFLLGASRCMVSSTLPKRTKTMQSHEMPWDALRSRRSKESTSCRTAFSSRSNSASRMVSGPGPVTSCDRAGLCASCLSQKTGEKMEADGCSMQLMGDGGKPKMGGTWQLLQKTIGKGFVTKGPTCWPGDPKASGRGCRQVAEVLGPVFLVSHLAVLKWLDCQSLVGYPLSGYYCYNEETSLCGLQSTIFRIRPSEHKRLTIGIYWTHTGFLETRHSRQTEMIMEIFQIRGKTMSCCSRDMGVVLQSMLSYLVCNQTRNRVVEIQRGGCYFLASLS